MSTTSNRRLGHFKAILFRRFTLVKRSWKSILISTIATILFSCLAIVAQFLLLIFFKEETDPISFKSYRAPPDCIAFAYSEADPRNLIRYENAIKKMFKKDLGYDPVIKRFETVDAMNKWLYEISVTLEGPKRMLLAYSFPDPLLYQIGPYPQPQITIHTNTSFTLGKVDLTNQAITTKLLWKITYGDDNDFSFSCTQIMTRLIDVVLGYIGPMLITIGVVSILPLIITQPIIDIRGEVREYMISCTLSVFSYWSATFLIDLIIWVITITFIWVIFVIIGITAFVNNLLASWYYLALVGPSFIMFSYCISFLFSSAESASRQAFLMIVILLLIPLIIDIIRLEQAPAWLNWIYSTIPPVNLLRGMTEILTSIGFMEKTFEEFWKDKRIHAFFIMHYGDLPIYIIILIIIESVRKKLQAMATKRTFGNYTEFFKEHKAKHPITEEADIMEAEAKDRTRNYAVRIENVSRLFFNTAGVPIPAVNCVSLGIEKGTTFGFLGANGAGKTTLIRMITSMLAPSDGSIEINGVNILKQEDQTLLANCPQFNSHLCFEMTPREHFYLFGRLFCYTREEEKEKSKVLVDQLELGDVIDKPLVELSDGEVRKLSIALAFFGPAEILLLDEPTASLDPVARKNVHEMISSFKGQKTFMLCTHLLSEAETLCDRISIMIKGCVYTCGSPSYLSAKFGTEFRIDVALEDDSEESEAKCTDFFEQNLPDAELAMVRPMSRIYSIQASLIKLPRLFVIMEEGKLGDNGYNYYTCSSSSLERVFMEIVRMSESEDIKIANLGYKKTEEESVSEMEESDGAQFVL